MDYYIARDCAVESNNKIWLLQNVTNGRYVKVSNEELKRNMRANRVDVANLTLTSDDRLVKASEYKFEAFNSMLKAPSAIRDNVQVISKDYSEKLEASIDKAIEQSLKTYTSVFGKYCVIKETDCDKNLLVAKFRVGVDTFIIAKYQKVVFGQSLHSTDIYFDILVGIEAIKCGDLFEYVKAVPSRLSQYAAEHWSSGGKISDELHCTNNSGIRSDWFTLSTSDSRTIIDGRFDLNNEEEEVMFANAIMRALADQMDEIIIQNPHLVNNVDIGQLVRYDEAKTNYIKLNAAAIGISIAGALVIGAITATSLATNPQILQTGLLAKIANTGTPQQILNTIKATSLVGGGVTGGLVAPGIVYGAFRKKAKNAKLDMKASRVIEGTVENVEYEEADRNERAYIRQKAKDANLL